MIQNPLNDMISYTIRRVATAMTSDLTNQLAELKLRITDANVLILIMHNDGITQSEIGRTLAIASANIAPVIGRLDQRNLLIRRPVDGRSHGLSLTEKGRKTAEKVFALTKAAEISAQEKIPEALRSDIVEALQNLKGDAS
ncbi:MarR family winged helix-turn-helix transcriptional regulator [Ponticaulis koreensis]|uniref:MarR family winged helix-turn-helix transcriptional regulator n=1 Tax=Ponticaulis koreensis TaxID=1123045 RepID=UPI00040A173F|nr:MarR family winged helix-turn-helix transcriptional regulator [Ponticaulis koreensis]